VKNVHRRISFSVSPGRGRTIQDPSKPASWLYPAFDRFPKLQIYWAENNVGWLPYFYEQIDHEYQINRFWAERHLGLPSMKRLPSEYLKEHAYWGFFEDRVGVPQHEAPAQ
jgi:hypothetical protein